MSKEQASAIDLNTHWFAMYYYASLFFQPAESPNIMISDKEMYLNTFRCDFF